MQPSLIYLIREFINSPIITRDIAPTTILRGTAHTKAISHPTPVQFRIIIVDIIAPKIPPIEANN